MTFEQDLADLARIVQRARPAWAATAITTRLRYLAGLGCTAGTTLDAALRAAQDATAETPVMIADPKYRAPLTVTPDPSEPRCEEHTDFPARTCRCCAADELAGMRPKGMRGKRVQSDQTPHPGTGRPEGPDRPPVPETVNG